MSATDTACLNPQPRLTSLRARLHGLISQRAMLLLILGMAAGLRLVGLNQVGFNSDEAVYAGQAAAIAQDEALSEFFPIFRAHPLLMQFLLSLVYRIGVSESAGRLLSAAIGIFTVSLVYALAQHLYGARVGLLAALFLALMPYHVVVTRQVLLDGLMTLFTTLTLHLLALYATSQNRTWLFAAGAGMGLSFLAKETGIVLLAAIYAFFALSPAIRVRLRDLALSTAFMALVMAPYPLTLMLAGGGGVAKTQQYLVWQLFRRPNHDWSFYPISVGTAIGPLLIVTAVLGLWLLWKENSWREILLFAWIVIPILFFQSWPVKGFHYLLVISPPIAVLSARSVGRWRLEPGSPRKTSLARLWRPLAIGTIALSLLIPSWTRVQPMRSGKFLAGAGGVPGGREAGLWLKEHSPEGSTLMTIGPSMANILQFFGHRKAFGLSVSPNPLHRNPSYQPIRNPDFDIRTGEIQYIVWDAYSAARSSFFSDKLLNYAQRYNGRVVHTESTRTTGPQGTQVVKPIIIIYEVRP